ncbi:MAG: AI-2E family transporter [Bacteroidales bacterium]|jgi:predicted PurR-regulated permease PerM|nr:AI-2E family transporter [Bacteroidales bacterium]
MKTSPENGISSESRSIDLIIKLLLILLLLVWCAMIILPFVVPVLWGIILAVTLHPLYNRLLKRVKGRKGLAGSIITILMLALLFVPFVWLVSSVIGSARDFVNSLRENTLVIPAPKPEVADWPLVGDPIFNAWQSLSTNTQAAVVQYKHQVLQIGDKLLVTFKSVTSNFLMMVLSVVISGVMLTNSEKSEKSIKSFASRLGGGSGEEFSSLVVLTIRNVAKGILGVAFIQFVLIGACLILAKVPLAGLWAIVVFLFAMVQLPVGIVAIPIIIYLYSANDPLPATIWSVLILVFAMSDAVLKPLLMGKGAPVPMLVIFLGAIGGMIMSGFIGLFTGAIVLSIGYKLILIWLGGGMKEHIPSAKND